MARRGPQLALPTNVSRNSVTMGSILVGLRYKLYSLYPILDSPPFFFFFSNLGNLHIYQHLVP